jgi:acetyltransferase-like isoleucine patch superfamily enzyme
MSQESPRPEKEPLHRRGIGFLRWLPWKVGYRWGPPLMSELRKRWVLARHPNATIRFGRNTYLGPGFSLDIPNRGSFICGNNVEFRRNFRAELSEGGRIVIGNDCHFTYDVVLACSTTLEIGERCVFAQATLVADGNHRYTDLARPMLEQGYEFHPIKIEDDALVHSKCTVVASIGRRAVIGANAVVTQPIPAYTLAGGVPARAISYFGPPEEEAEGRADALAEGPGTDAG